MNDTRPLSEAYSLVADLAGLLEVRNLSVGEGRVWIMQLDKQWIFAINGKDTKEHVEPKDTMGAEIDHCEMAVWFNGWLAGILTPFSGTFVIGEGANEDNFITALKMRISEEQEEHPEDDDQPEPRVSFGIEP